MTRRDTLKSLLGLSAVLPAPVVAAAAKEPQYALSVGQPHCPKCRWNVHLEDWRQRYSSPPETFAVTCQNPQCLWKGLWRIA